VVRGEPCRGAAGDVVFVHGAGKGGHCLGAGTDAATIWVPAAVNMAREKAANEMVATLVMR